MAPTHHPRRRLPRPGHLFGAGLPLALLCCIHLSCGQGKPEVPTSRAELVALLGSDYRPTQGRLSGFGYAPCASVAADSETEPLDPEGPFPGPGAADLVPRLRCSSTDDLPHGTRDLLRLAHARVHPLDGTAFRGPADAVEAVQDHHFAGLVELLGKSESDLDLAVRYLERAAELAPEDAQAHGDLATAYLERASALDQPRDLARALEAAERSFEADPLSQNAAFNRAVAYSSLFLSRQAIEAWEDYLQLDASSRWADTARDEIARLDQPSAGERWALAEQDLQAALDQGDLGGSEELRAQFPNAARSYGEDALQRQWASAVVAGALDEGELWLSRAEALGGLLAQAGDFLVADAATAIRAAVGSAAYAEQAGALADLASLGRLACLRVAGARVQLQEIAQRLEAASSPLAIGAKLELVNCDYYGNLYEDALARIATLLEEIPAGYPFLRANALHMQGLTHYVLGQQSGALTSYLEALSIYESFGQVENSALMQRLLAEVYRRREDEARTWQHIYAGLARRLHLRSPAAVAVLSADLAPTVSEDEPFLALVLHDDASSSAVAAAAEGAPNASAFQAVALNSHIFRALDLLRLGRDDEAPAELDAARALLASPLLSAESREREAARLALVEGSLQVETDPEAAIASLGQTLQSFGPRRNTPFLVQAHALRARAFLRLGDDHRAEGDLEAGIRESLRQAESIHPPWLRPGFQDRSAGLFDDMVLLKLRQGRNPLEALHYVEQGRAQAFLASLAELPGGSPRKPQLLASASRAIRPEEIQRGLRHDEALLEYALAHDKVLLWLLTRTESHFFELPTTTAELEKDIEAFVAAIQANDTGPATLGLGESLHTRLLAPARHHLDPHQTLVISPDGVLHGLPFAALRDPEAGRYLIEDHPILFTASGTAYASNGPRPDLDLRDASLLVIADPAADPSGFPHLARLSGAAEEAKRIRALFPPEKARLITGEKATRDALLGGLGRADILHYSGHAVSSSAPLSAALALGPDPETGASGILTASELFGRNYQGSSLIVLAACASSGREYSGASGPASLVSPLLAGGSRWVLATLWALDDWDTTLLLESFYRQLLKGENPASALQTAASGYLPDSRFSVWPNYQLYT